MPDPSDPRPSAQNMSEVKPLEVDVTEQSLRNYEVSTMADDLASVPSPISGEPKDAPQRQTGRPQGLADAPPVSLPPDLFEVEDSGRSLQMKRFFLGFFGVLFLGLVGFGIYWYVGIPFAPPLPPTSVTPPTAPPTPSSVTPPLQFDSPLIPVNKTLALKIPEGGDSQTFLASIKRAMGEESSKIEKGDFVRLYLHSNGKKLSLSDLEKVLGQPFSSSIKAYLDEEGYTLFYEKGEEDAIRFGIALTMTNRASVENASSNFERTAPLFMRQLYARYVGSELPLATVEEFFDNAYKEVSIRYMNFGSPSLTLDYALDGDLFLVAGSRDTMFALIDRLKLK